MRLHSVLLTILALFLLSATATSTSAQSSPADDPVAQAEAGAEKVVRELLSGPTTGPVVKEAEKNVDEAREDVARIIDPHHGGEGGEGPGAGQGDDGTGSDAPSLGAAMLGNGGLLAGLAALGLLSLISLGSGAMGLVSRYVDPKVALDNPQRSMLFGFIKGHPGVHLKQLSEDFDMKTSTVLWHVRKLEAAELIRSQKVNGYRVFYPVAGGLEAKQVGAAVAALGNANALRILEYVSARPGIDQRAIADTLDINPGTVRWHLRKLRDRGILCEMSEGRTSRYSATELGARALRQTRGTVAPSLVAVPGASSPPAHPVGSDS